jgi:hypothetical protein
MTGEVPDHGPQFGFDVKADAVVDQPDVMVGIDQDVAALAVGVVDQRRTPPPAAAAASRPR